MDQSILDILTLYTDMCLGFLIVLAVLIIYTLYSVINHAVAIYLDSEIPGPFAFPLIGNLFDVAFVKEEDRFAFHQNLRMKYGDIYRLYLGRKKIIYLHNYDLIREMLVEKKNIFGEKPGCYPVLSGHGIMFSNGKQFKIFKEIALSAIYKRGFKKDAMEAIMHDEVSQVIDYIKMTKGQGFSPKEIMTFISANLLNQIAFGFRYKYEDNYFKGILKNLEPMFHCLQPDSLSLFLPFGIFLNLNAAILGKKLFDHCQKHSRKKNIAEDNQESFVSMFLRGKDRSDSKSKKYFTNYEKERCALDLFFAGSETTSSTLRWLLLYMIEFPEVQEKCFQEIKKVVGDIDETISLRHKSKLPYVSATIMEVMRSAVIVTKLTPREAKENTTLQGHFVKRGSLVLVDISSVMTDKKYWKEPNIFKPERFLDEEGNIRKSRRCIFFSTGPRSCPGEIFASELTFVSFANLIANFKFIKEDDNDLNDLGIIFRVSNSCRDYRLRAVLRHN